MNNTPCYNITKIYILYIYSKRKKNSLPPFYYKSAVKLNFSEAKKFFFPLLKYSMETILKKKEFLKKFYLATSYALSKYRNIGGKVREKPMRK